MSYVLEALREPKNPDITYAPDGKQIDHWTEQGFLIFLHSIILYDKIVTNSSKVGLVQWHLKQVTGPHTAELDISYSGIGDNRGGLREILSETLHYNMRLMRGGKIEPLKLPTKDRSLSEYYAGYVEEREFGTTRELLAREFLLQSLLYASHAHGETKITGNICVYAARPGVIRILSSF
jgi:hypothetical protein